MPETQLEMVTRLITDLEKSLEETIKRIEECDPSDPTVSYLTREIDRINERLNFLKDHHRDIVASGKTIYMFAFGSLDDIRQRFQNTKFNTHYIPEQLFTSISLDILERENTPSKKIKMLNNLVKVYEEFKE
ncbi:hypothetical protein [Paenibacillus alvei]|uniref:hypothetical protein n=1 Tax=Paenibacillus alvei TaxID=44250 RepID=UPI0022823E99|nr:hypothetical protein [Paenibacillus alvei]